MEDRIHCSHLLLKDVVDEHNKPLEAGFYSLGDIV